MAGSTTNFGCPRMMQPLVKMVQCLSPAGLHHMAYKQWGDPDNPEVLVCVHGVSRVSGDFDRLAADLSDRYRVICPDVVGRGLSSWLKNPQFYAVPQYVSDMVTLVARLDVPRYMGTWHEIAKYPNWFQRRCVGDTSARYSQQPDGTVQVLNRCRREDGSFDEALGQARQIGAADSPMLQVRFAPAWLSFVPLVWGDY